MSLISVLWRLTNIIPEIVLVRFRCGAGLQTIRRIDVGDRVPDLTVSIVLRGRAGLPGTHGSRQCSYEILCTQRRREKAFPEGSLPARSAPGSSVAIVARSHRLCFPPGPDAE